MTKTIIKAQPSHLGGRGDEVGKKQQQQEMPLQRERPTTKKTLAGLESLVYFCLSTRL